MATTTIKQHVPIFICSTFEDMVHYRNSVKDAIVSLKHIVIGMELFGSSNEKPLNKCLSEVRNSSLLICLVGMRYGQIDNDSGLSFTHLEYKEAIKNNIPVLVYILSDDVPILPKYVDKGESFELLNQFKNELIAKHTISYFTNTDNIYASASRDIVKALEQINTIQINKSQLLDIKEESPLIILRMFLNRPKKYTEREIELLIELKTNNDKFTYGVNPDYAVRAGLIKGDTVGFQVRAIDIETNDSCNFFLYACGNEADYIERCAEGDRFKATVRLRHVEFKFIQDYESGRAYITRDTHAIVAINIIN